MGAGIGPLMGHRGLMSDALESVRMVTADGKLATASKSENADLFWAVRGAGSNFGVVTSATFKVYDITNKGQVMIADLVYPAVVNQSFWRILQSFDHDLPSRLAMTGVGLYDRERNMVSCPDMVFSRIADSSVAGHRASCGLFRPTRRRRSVPGTFHKAWPLCEQHPHGSAESDVPT